MAGTKINANIVLLLPAWGMRHDVMSGVVLPVEAGTSSCLPAKPKTVFDV